MSPAPSFSLVVTDAGLGLSWHEHPEMKPLTVDFLSGKQAYRGQQANKKDEAIARACMISRPVTVLDATAGLARDAWVLVQLGAKVTLNERQPLVRALLDDALQRLHAAQPEYQQRLQLAPARALGDFAADSFDVVYLDPMYPKGDRKQKATVKKDMQMFQQLVGSDADADALLAPACRVARRRVVVKRPLHADFLAGRRPDHQVISKKHRFDIYLSRQS
ncbi:class I SAM-dependent methyltransferase [Pseudidiomarina insulisalsae]|uniref:Ribosomal RNA small subunit methyltransferase J n=1 Tax=Pseudidiomarina insulisalsae TaxID=575789 RepID=A0A432YQV1_9GAMM|nr:class I SAM-dependent methyltransferase [Pseudidiomarina insulisalsae]RUO63738.1 16S rRNA methyltransferase [Pseudidiomarina insulisalsae]